MSEVFTYTQLAFFPFEALYVLFIDTKHQKNELQRQPAFSARNTKYRNNHIILMSGHQTTHDVIIHPVLQGNVGRKCSPLLSET